MYARSEVPSSLLASLLLLTALLLMVVAESAAARVDPGYSSGTTMSVSQPQQQALPPSVIEYKQDRFREFSSLAETGIGVAPADGATIAAESPAASGTSSTVLWFVGGMAAAGLAIGLLVLANRRLRRRSATPDCAFLGC
jgi:hypothetical protein